MQPREDPSPFLRSVREAIRVRHYSIRTEQAYVQWIKRFILFHGKRHPAEMGEPEVAAFLSHLALDREVASATQNQALNALVFLYRNVVQRPLGKCAGIVRVKRQPRLPILRHLGEPTSPPEAAPARGPPLWGQAAEPVPDWADSPAPVPEFVVDQRLSW